MISLHVCTRHESLWQKYKKHGKMALFKQISTRPNSTGKVNVLNFLILENLFCNIKKSVWIYDIKSYFMISENQFFCIRNNLFKWYQKMHNFSYQELEFLFLVSEKNIFWYKKNIFWNQKLSQKYINGDT